jgi:hypothetical protein
VAKLAEWAGTSNYLDVPAVDIPVDDLNPAERGKWSTDQHVRFYRSGFAAWVVITEEADELPMGGAATLEFDISRTAAAACARAFGTSAQAKPDEPVDTADLQHTSPCEWNEDQLARGWRSGMLCRLPSAFWESLAEHEAEKNEGGEDYE